MRRESLLGKPENLHPFNNFKDVSKLHSLCVPALGELHAGKFDLFCPALAWKIEKRTGEDGALEYWIHLREDIVWQPLKKEHFPDLTLSPWFLEKRPVTAYDFKFYLDAVMNPFLSEPKAASLRSYYSDLEGFRVENEKTFVVRWKSSGDPPRPKFNSFALTVELRPLPSFVYQHFADGTKIISGEEEDDYRKSSVWAQNFSNHFAKNTIVSCGSWIFHGMNEEGIRLRRNGSYFNPYIALTKGLELRFESSIDNVFQDFKADKIDLCYLSPIQSGQLEAFLNSDLYKRQESEGNKVALLDYVDSAYSYIAWNQNRELFASNKVRLAMTLAIDRQRLISQNLSERAVQCTGPFHCYSPSYDGDLRAWPHAPDLAKRLLEEEGWHDLDGDGIRERHVNGEKQLFSFSLVYYNKSQLAKSIGEYVATELKKIGVDCRPIGLEIADLSRTFDDKNFDALQMGWSLGCPPEDPKQLWYSKLADEKGSSNVIGFKDPIADRLIEELLYEYDPEARLNLYHRFHKLIHESAAYTFLYFPRARLLYRSRLKNLFIPRDRQDLIENAAVYEPDLRFTWIEDQKVL